MLCTRLFGEPQVHFNTIYVVSFISLTSYTWVNNVKPFLWTLLTDMCISGTSLDPGLGDMSAQLITIEVTFLLTDYLQVICFDDVIGCNNFS